MNDNPHQFFRAFTLRVFSVLALGFVTAPRAMALQVTEDFEDDPAHPFSWAVLQNAAGMADWTVLQNGTNVAPTPAWATAIAGNSFNGNQALMVAADPLVSGVTVRRVSPLATPGIAFAGVAVRVPHMSAAGSPLVPANVLSTDAPLQLEGVWFASFAISSGLAQWHYWNSGSGNWVAVGPVLAVGAGADGMPSEWSRINIRRQSDSLDEADIWINGKPVAVKVPLDGNSLGFQLRPSPSAASFVDALTFNENQPLFVDGDRDGMPDSWEFLYSGVGFPQNTPALMPSVNDREADPDGDGVSNIREYLAGSSPLLGDSDGDSMPDAWEIEYGLNPSDAKDADGDFDFDGVLNREERN